MEKVKDRINKCNTCICYHCNTEDCTKKKWCEVKSCTHRHNSKCTGHGEYSEAPMQLTSCIYKLFKKGINQDESK